MRHVRDARPLPRLLAVEVDREGEGLVELPRQDQPAVLGHAPILPRTGPRRTRSLRCRKPVASAACRPRRSRPSGPPAARAPRSPSPCLRTPATPPASPTSPRPWPTSGPPPPRRTRGSTPPPPRSSRPSSRSTSSASPRRTRRARSAASTPLVRAADLAERALEADGAGDEQFTHLFAPRLPFDVLLQRGRARHGRRPLPRPLRGRPPEGGGPRREGARPRGGHRRPRHLGREEGDDRGPRDGARPPGRHSGGAGRRPFVCRLVRSATSTSPSPSSASRAAPPSRRSSRR